MTDTELLTTAEAARLLKVSPTTIARWIKQGLLPACHVGPRQVRIRRADHAAMVTPVVPRGESPPSNGTAETVSRVTVHPLTDEERRATLTWLDDARRLRERMRARLGGRVLPSSAQLIREMREERSSER